MKYYLTLIIRRRYAALSVAIAVLSVCTWAVFSGQDVSSDVDRAYRKYFYH